MPFDGTVSDAPKPLPGADDNLLGFSVSQPCPSTKPRRNGRLDSVASTLAVLALARDPIADDRRWCKGAFARTWFHIPVRVGSGMARRAEADESLKTSVDRQPALDRLLWDQRRLRLE
jgi:hypothetical protein